MENYVGTKIPNSMVKQFLVSKMINWNDRIGCENKILYGELNQVNWFMKEISEYKLSTQEQNTWEWKGEKNKFFIVKTAYIIIQNNCNGKQIDFSFITIWELKVIPCALQFVWQVGFICVITKNNLGKRWVWLSCNLCVWCN